MNDVNAFSVHSKSKKINAFFSFLDACKGIKRVHNATQCSQNAFWHGFRPIHTNKTSKKVKVVQICVTGKFNGFFGTFYFYSALAVNIEKQRISPNFTNGAMG